MGSFVKRKSSVQMCSGFSPVASFQFVKPRVRNASDVLLVSAGILLYCFNTSKAKRFTLHLVVRDPWPLFELGRLKGSISRLFVPKLSLRKHKSLRVITFITQLWKKRVLNFTMIPTHWHIFRAAAFRVHIKNKI